MSSAPSPEIPRILSFWFDHPTPEPSRRWFGGGTGLDEEVRSNFAGLVAQARTTQLDNWTATPNGTLALILLLDQFPRNIYRGSADAYASDAKALRIATAAIARGFDRSLPFMQQSFMYLPLMHDETLLSQVAGYALYEGLLARAEKTPGLSESEMEFLKMGPGFTKRHLDAIVKFGRFCGRNEALGRESTEEEREVLKENPVGF